MANTSGSGLVRGIKSGEGTTTFANARILTGEGEQPFPGEVTTRGNRIVEV